MVEISQGCAGAETIATSSDAVKISGLRFSYPGKAAAAVLDMPDWRIPRGGGVFVNGASGSGKSTLLNLLAGILTATAGTVEILGQDLATLSARRRDAFRAKHMGIVFQQFNLIQYLSVLDNIRLAAYFGVQNIGAVESRALALFAALELDRTLIRKPASDLSVGQQQRVAIVRALINAPEILIADEPTSALDSDTRDAFMALLMTISRAQGITLIVASHDIALSQCFQQVISLSAINRCGGAQRVY
ncbi:MAG: ABC transporter ATP-binding protein [Nitrosomonas sp.]|nr:MAG: ABC transporter ATP-binding protein [Nitrosomonas sp.]